MKRGPDSIAALVVEMQRALDADKRWTWPLYLAGAHARLRVPSWLVVLTLDATVARWARESIATLQGGVLQPIVIGPDELPKTRRDGNVELAVLVAMAHGRGEEGGAHAARALLAIRRAGSLDETRARLYNDLVLASIDDLARVALEATMKTEGWVWQSDFAKHWVGVGEELGLEKGREEGREEGREDGERRAVRLLCDALGVAWTDERASYVAAASLIELDSLVQALGRERGWPD